MRSHSNLRGLFKSWHFRLDIFLAGLLWRSLFSTEAYLFHCFFALHIEMGAVADLFVLLQLLFLYQGDLNHVRTARWAVHEPG